MSRHDPLTYRYPRTLAELDSADRAGWARAEASAADDEHIRAQLVDRIHRDHRSLVASLVRLALLIASVGFLLGLMWGKLP